jgi:hypothetical protein
MDSLGLRFTQAGSSLAPPDVAAFAAVDSVLLHEQEADHDDRSPLADLVAAGIVATRIRMIVDDEPAALRGPVFVTLRSTPIPTVRLTESGAPEVAAFVLADRVHGHFAWPRSRRGSALVLAACLPLALPDVAQAQVAGSAKGRSVAVEPASVVPPAPAGSAKGRSVAVEPASVVPPAPAPAPQPVVASEAPVVSPPVVGPPPPPRIASPAAQLETILQGMKGREAVVYAAGAKVTGLIIGVDGDFVTIIDVERDGKIALIPKLQIVEVRGRMSAQETDLPTGTGNLVAGGILVGVGGPLMLSGLVFLGISPSYLFLYLPQIVPAGVMLGVGIPNLVTGMRKRRAYQAASRGSRLSERLTPAVNRTPHGSWTGGLRLQF